MCIYDEFYTLMRAQEVYSVLPVDMYLWRRRSWNTLEVTLPSVLQIQTERSAAWHNNTYIVGDGHR